MLLSRLLLLGVASAGALVFIAPSPSPAAPSPAAAEASAVASSSRVISAQERIRTASARVDTASARLAAHRSMMQNAPANERPLLERQEQRLEEAKDARLAELRRASRNAAQVARDERSRTATSSPAVQESTTGIVLATEKSTAGGTAPTRPVSVGDRVSTRSGIVPTAASAAPTPQPTLTAGADATSIDAYLASKSSPMTGLGAVFVAEARAVGLDPRFLVAIAGAETSFGTYGPSQTIQNPFGLGPGMRFNAWADSIRYAARNLAGPLYRGRGHVTIPAIHGVWAPIGAGNDPTGLNNHWTVNVSMYYAQQGGDPQRPVFIGAPDPAAAIPALGTQAQLDGPVLSNQGPKAAVDALELLGTPHPADAPDGGLDDVGLVRTVYAAHGVAVPERRNAVALEGSEVAPKDLRRGDVILFGDRPNNITHLGIYIGAGQFVHAPGAGDQTRLSSLYDQHFGDAWVGARRL